jgi:hypothetical protein
MGNDEREMPANLVTRSTAYNYAPALWLTFSAGLYYFCAFPHYIQRITRAKAPGGRSRQTIDAKESYLNKRGHR